MWLGSLTVNEAGSLRTNSSGGGGGGGEGEFLPSSRLMRMCRWMGSKFHDWIDYYGMAFL